MDHSCLYMHGGSLLIVLFLKRFKKYPILFFVLAVLLTEILEYFTGYFMFQIWNRTWWTYEGEFLNIDGYVCLYSVISFAIGGLLLIYILEPLIKRFVSKANPKLINIIIIVFFSLFLIDNRLSNIYRNPK